MGTLALDFGKYKILKKLASGGMADIHLATPKVFANSTANLKQLLVIKRVIDGTGSNPELLSGLKDEAKALSRLKHSNIVAFKEFVEDAGQCYLVMEYVPGKSLHQIIQLSKDAQMSLSIEHILHIVSEIASGLDYAHSCYDQYFKKFLNLVHRDINPQNIMISDQGEVKIIDFGISKFDSREVRTKTGYVKGKLSYLSPEQIDHRSVDARTDIYALGVVMWEMLAGRKLFDGKSSFEKADQIRTSQIPSLCDINPMVTSTLNQIVMKALEFSPEMRYQSANDLKYEIVTYMAKTYPTYSVKSFKELVKEFESVKILNIPMTNAENVLTDKIESPSGLYSQISSGNIVIDVNRHKLRINKNSMNRSLLNKKTKRRKKRSRSPQINLFDVFLNAAVVALSATFISYLILFFYKTGHLKSMVGVVMQILNLV